MAGQLRLLAAPRHAGGGALSYAVRALGLGKRFRKFSPGHRLRTLKSVFVRSSASSVPRASEPTVQALEDVSFEVEKGELFSIIGSNGSGKSTLLKIISGILRPSAGQIEIDGRVTALIELGAGFHPEISGRENVFISGSVLGLSRREIEKRYERIVEFSGLAEFLEEPVKNYSSGMYVRLGFAVAIHTDPDVLLVDEVLAVGDEAFAHRCVGKIEELLAAGKTVIFVSHGLAQVEELSTRVLWLDRGRVQLVGEPRRVVDAYRQRVAEAEGESHRAEKERREQVAREGAAGEAREGAEGRWGSGAAEIEAVRLFDAAGAERYHFATGDAVRFELDVVAREPLDDFVFSVSIATPRNLDVWSTSSEHSGQQPLAFAGRGRVRLVCPRLRLGPGEYLVDAAVHSRNGAPYDYRKRLLVFTVTASERGGGVYFPEHRWEFLDGVTMRGKEES